MIQLNRTHMKVVGLMVVGLLLAGLLGAGAALASGESPASWYVSYYDNVDLAGSPVYTTSEGAIDHDWGSGAPADGVPADNWSGRWTAYKEFEAGTYRFTITSDDGARIFVGDKHIHVDWVEHPALTSYVDVSLTGGRYAMAVDYFDAGGKARLALGWERRGPAVAGAADVTIVRRGDVGDEPSPAPQDGWRARYWNNRTLQGTPVLTRNEAVIGYDWHSGSPAPGVNADNWSARWTRNVTFSAGTYRFHTASDDGVRVIVGNAQVIEDWSDHPVRGATATVSLAAGTYPVTVEYYEHGGDAVLRFWWERVSDSGATPPEGSWSATYWNNRSLEGLPAVRRREAAVDYNWGSGSPAVGVTPDNWSARWTRNVAFQGGTYRFTVISDDGVHLFVDEQLIVNDWTDHAAREATTTINLTEGTHPVAIDYYEHGGEARLHVSWQRIGDGDTGSGGVSAAPRVYLRLRAGPGTSYTILDVVPPGTIVPVLARTESGAWVQVEYGGRVGWMYSGLMTIYGDLGAVPVG